MKPFEVGDKVRRINESLYSARNVHVDHTGILTEFEPGHARWARVKWDHLVSGSLSNTCWNELGNLELVVEPCQEEYHRKEPSEALRKLWAGEGAKHGKPSNPKDRAATHRVDMSVFPESASIFGALAMTEGAAKYGAYNYRTVGVNVSTYVAAAKRHLGKYYDRGEWADGVTGVPHLANALACIAVLIDGHCQGNLTDDRPPRMAADLYPWAEALSKKLHTLYPAGPPRVTESNKGACLEVVPDWLTAESTRTQSSDASKGYRT